MIKLYKGPVQAKPEDVCLFMLDSSGPEKIFTYLVFKHEDTLTKLDFSLLEKKYYFHIKYSPSLDYPILKFLEELEKAFPQIIWTKIIKSESGYYKVEFIPVPFHSKRESEDGSLADCLEEMGYHAENLIPTFRSKFEEAFKICDKNSSHKIDLTWTNVVKKTNESITSDYDKESKEDELLVRLNDLQSQFQKKKHEKETKNVRKIQPVHDKKKKKVIIVNERG